MDDNAIVDLFLDRNESAISYTAEKYGTRLLYTSRKITEDIAASEECVNDTYLEAWNRIPPNEPRTYLLAFLSKIVRNISINKCLERNRLKRKAFIIELSEELEQCIPGSDSVENHLESIELGRIISDYLYSLPKEKRLVFMYRYYYLDSIKSIARRFKYSRSKVKTMLFRIRNDLRDYLVKEGYDV